MSAASPKRWLLESFCPPLRRRMLESLLSEQVGWHLGRRVLFIETLAQKWFQWAFPVSFSAFKTTRRYQRRNPRVVTGCVRKPVWVEFSSGHRGHAADGRARAETGLTNTAKATSWTGAAGKSCAEIQGSVEHAALMTSVDLQDIVGMSRKNDSAILKQVFTHGCIRFNQEPHAFHDRKLRWFHYDELPHEEAEQSASITLYAPMSREVSSLWEYISPKTLHCKCASSKSWNKLQINHKSHNISNDMLCIYKIAP